MFEDINDIFEELLTDDEEEIINIVEMPRAPRQFHARVTSVDEWSDTEFINRYRLSKESVNILLEQIEERIQHPTQRNHPVSPLTQLLITLRFFASGSMLIVAGDFGGVTKATACRIVKSVSRCIAELAPIYIRMPHTNNEIATTKAMFSEIAQFPNVIGAIDCTHVRIQSPGGDNAEQYRNRKGYFSFNVQTISDAHCKICNVVVRWPGATHDSRIFNNSQIKAQLEQGQFGDSYLLGDSGYPLTNYVMTPLRNPITPAENLYNELHIRTRNVVERSYGIWKRRFPILRLEMRLKIETIQAVIVATAVLHNIALENVDEQPEDNNFHQEEDDLNFDHQEVQNQQGILLRENIINNHFANLL